MSDNEEAQSQMTTLSNPMRNELLCFVVQKSNVLTFDHLVKLCTDFFREEEIIAARKVLDPLLENRLPRNTGANKCATLKDIVKSCLNPGSSLPQFYAVDLSRLPPVGTEYCDMSAILHELQALRAEVRQIVCLRDEISAL